MMSAVTSEKRRAPPATALYRRRRGPRHVCRARASKPFANRSAHSPTSSGGKASDRNAATGRAPIRRHIAQPARQAAVSHRLRRVPVAAEVHPLKRKISRHHQLFARTRTQHGAVIADPHPHLAAARACGGLQRLNPPRLARGTGLQAPSSRAKKLSPAPPCSSTPVPPQSAVHLRQRLLLAVLGHHHGSRSQQ